MKLKKMMKVKIKILSNGRGLPVLEKQTKGAACVDLYAANYDKIVIPPRGTRLIPTGFSIEVPYGYEAQIRSRSGLALKKGVFVGNSPGTIDSDYRGEVSVILFNESPLPFCIERGDRMAQMTIKKIEEFEFEYVDELSDTDRGNGGFGSTGL